MTIQQLLTSLEAQAFWLLLYLLALPLGSLLLYLLPQRARSTGPWPYIYSTLVYLSCGPGVLSALLIGYSLFFIRQNLLEVSLLIYFAPLAAMLLTLALLSKQVRFKDLPGFDRLSGLMILIAVSFSVALLISKLFVGVFFGGSLISLLMIGGVLLVLLQSAWGKLTRK